MTYAVKLVHDDVLSGALEWLLVEEPGRLVLVIAASSFCARVVAEGLAAVGDRMARRSDDMAA